MTFTLDRKLITSRERHYYYTPIGRIQVKVSGTDDQGCTHRAGPKVLHVLPEDGVLAIVVPAAGGARAKYDISSQPGTDFFPYTKICPGASAPFNFKTTVAWIQFPPRPMRTSAKVVQGRFRTGPWVFQWCLNRARAGLTRPYTDAKNRLNC